MEALVVICDVCGKTLARSVTLRVGTTNRVKDFCETHLTQLLDGSRSPRRGRPTASTKASSANGRAQSAKTTTRKRTGTRKPTSRKRTAKK
jgi:hypothetical protein